MLNRVEKQKYLSLIQKMVEQRKSEALDQKRVNTRERNIRVAGIIHDYLSKKYEAEVIVTGGLSVEYYTEGNYTTQDIDMITSAQRELESVLANLNFVKEGKYWIHNPLEILIEIVASIPFDGVYKQPLAALTKDGYSVRFVDINDILMDRVRGFVHWKNKDYGRLILELINRHLDELDDDYLKQNLSEKDEYETLLYHMNLNKDPNSIEAQANRIKRSLGEKELSYSEIKQNEDAEYLAFPLSNKAKDDLGNYFGILIVPYFDILLYNNDEEEFEAANSPDILTVLVEYAAKYGEPFSSIAEALKKEVVE